MLKQTTIALLTLAAMGSAQAASGDAWAEFATEVETGCIEASADFFGEATAVVDPFGSENYGLAIVTGETSAGTTSSIICVFDKQSKAIQIGGELDVVVTPANAAE